MTSWSSLPFKAKLYISAVVVAAFPVLYHALKTVLSPHQDFWWLLLTAFTLLTVPLFVLHPGFRSGVTIGDAFVISICMMFGIEPAVVANMLYIGFLSLLLRRNHKTPVYRIVFNSAAAVINVCLYGTVYHSLQSISVNSIERTLLPTFGLAVTYFFANSLSIAIGISLSSNSRLFDVWRKNYAPVAIYFFVSAGAAALIVSFQGIKGMGIAAPLLIAPTVAAIWGSLTTMRAKTLDAQAHLKEQEELYHRTVETLARAVDAKDQTTYGHIRRVKAYALGLAKLAGIADEKALKALEFASLLHDFGKLAIEDYLLNKPGRLSKQEFEKMKVHSIAGDEILQQVEFPFPVAKYVRYHHERWDGTGYPDGLKGEDIPIGARILSIADAFDAIRSTRRYKPAFGIDDSVEILRAQAGSGYDPKLVGLFISHVDELELAADEAARNISELSFRKYFAKVDSEIAQADASVASQTPPTTASEELVRLFEFCNGMGRSLGLADTLPILARRLKHIVPYDSCVFYLYHDDDSVKAEYACGECAESLRGTSIGMGKGISGWVAAYKRPMLNTSPALEFQGIAGDFAALQDALAVPVVQDGDCLGTISLYARQPASYSQTHLSLLQTVAEQIAQLMSEAGADARTREEGLLDPVTGTYRVAYLSVAGAQILAHAAKTEAPLSLVYLDIKNFSQSVALFGAGTGDLILRKVADVLRSELRQTDILVRFGHRGFVALLPGVRNPQALRFVHRLQQQIRSTPINLGPGNTLFVTLQVGIAAYPGDGPTLLALLQAAQRALNEQAKLATPQTTGSEGNVFEFPTRI